MRIMVSAMPGEDRFEVQREAQALANMSGRRVWWEHNKISDLTVPETIEKPVDPSSEINSAIHGFKVEEMSSGQSLTVDGFIYANDEFALQQILESNLSALKRAQTQVSRIRAAIKYVQDKAIEPTAEEVEAVRGALQGRHAPTGDQLAALSYDVAKAVKRAGA